MAEQVNAVIRFEAETFEIIGVTLRVALSSITIASLLGIFGGLLLEKTRFPGKKHVVRMCRTLMGTPPVVVGLAVYLLLMRKGPLGSLQLLFTVRGMIIAQVLLITPIICGMVYSYASEVSPRTRAFAKTMGANEIQTQILMIKEMKNEIYFVVVTGFGRAISEVGSVMIVGGNIQNKTRTMTTAISLMRNKGEYAQAIALGVVLLIIAFVLQWFADFLRREVRVDENF